MRLRSLPSVERILLVGGRLCLDFANTANRLDGGPCDERLERYEDLLRWSQRLGLLDTPGLGRLRRLAKKSPRRADRALQAALELRECLMRVFSQTASAQDLDRLEKAARVSPKLRRIANGRVVLEPGTDLSGWLLRAVSNSAIELLTSKACTSVNQCPGHRCGWLFVDESPGGRRKWCSMRTCGNRQKARQHYAASKLG